MKFKKGDVPWNKGLTKNTDPRVKKASEKLMGNTCSKGRTLTEVHKKRVGDAMRGREITWGDKISKTLIGAYVGENSSQWKGGITIFNHKIRGLPEYRQWVKDVFRRDSWICQKCGQKGGNLNAHHIICIAEIILENKLKSIKDALNCKQLWRIDNGLTLCKECHKLERKK